MQQKLERMQGRWPLSSAASSPLAIAFDPGLATAAVRANLVELAMQLASHLATD